MTMHPPSTATSNPTIKFISDDNGDNGDIKKMQPLQQQDCKVTDVDIVCGRGKIFASHPGNIRFNSVVKANLQRYAQSTRRMDKSIVVATIVNTLKNETGARFLKLDKQAQQYYELNYNQAHDKTGHAIRDLLKRVEPNSKNSNPPRSRKKKQSSHCKKNFSKPSFNKSKTDFMPLQLNKSFSSDPVVENFLDNVLKVSDFPADNSNDNSVDLFEPLNLMDMDLFLISGDEGQKEPTTINRCGGQGQSQETTICFAPLPISSITTTTELLDSADFWKVCEILSESGGATP